MRTPRNLATTFAILALAAPATFADTVITEKRVREPFTMMGQSQERLEETVTTWIGDGTLRRDEGGATFIVDAKANKLYILDNTARTTSPVDLPIDIASFVPAEMLPMVEQMRAAMQLEATVTPSTETATIAGHTAKRVDILVTGANGMKTELAMWLTTDLGIDQKLFQLAARAMASLQPAGDAIVDKILALDGYPIRTTTKATMMGTTIQTSEELVTVETKKPAAGWYTPPADYAIKRFNPMEPPPGAAN